MRQPVPRTDASGNLLVALDGSPRSVAVGPRGPWVLSAPPAIGDPPRNRIRVSEVDPRTGAVRGPTPVRGVGSPRFGAGARGAYVVGGYPDVGEAPRLALVQAGTHRVVLGPRRSQLIKQPSPIGPLAVGAGGVWLVDLRHVLRADPRSGRIVRVVTLPADPRARAGRRCRTHVSPDLFATGSDAIWVTAQTVHRCSVGRPHQDVRRSLYHTLWRIDPKTNRAARGLSLPGPYLELAAGPAGVWATRCATRLRDHCTAREDASRRLLRLGRRGNRPTAVTRLPAGEIEGLAVGGDAVWVSQRVACENRGVLRRIDVASGRMSTALTLSGPPSNVAAGRRGVWVLDTYERILVRVAR